MLPQSRQPIVVLLLLVVLLSLLPPSHSWLGPGGGSLTTRVPSSSSSSSSRIALLPLRQQQEGLWHFSSTSSLSSSSVSSFSSSPNTPTSTSPNPTPPRHNDDEWQFFDTARIHVSGGSGGNGCVAFRREKGEARGGPNGGSGGRGGSIYLQCDDRLNTLLSVRNKVHHTAHHGLNGQGKGRDGSAGSDIVLFVPPGTVVRDLKTQRLAGELTTVGQTLLVAKGGRGGRGNAAFMSARRTAPKLAERGEPGAARWLALELKLVADVGLVGQPNAGKSTLLSVVSAARPKIADYPFTTVVPNLGVCTIDGGRNDKDGKGLVLCDIPGLIQGAAQGAGMGGAFLRHVQRCRVLLHVVDGTAEDPLAEYRIIQQELQEFDAKLIEKPQVIVINKVDVPQVRERQEELAQALRQEAGHSRIMVISAATTQGVTELMHRLRKLVMAQPSPQEGDDVGVVPEIDLSRAGLDYDSDDYVIQSDPSYPGQWRITGPHIENIARMTHWEYPEAVERFGRQLEALGISYELAQRGAEEGDLIMIDDYDFEFSPGMTNPYIPPDLLEMEMLHRAKSTGGAAAGATTTKTGAAGQKEVDHPWRPFRDGGYLDVDTEEFAGFNQEDGEWDLLDQDDEMTIYNNDDEDSDDATEYADDEVWIS